ncbi:hypothetical protein M1N16_04985 [Nitrospinaceae bacterium]|nr:hypothetical protein [Nitrospinaceae bacterium]
MEITRRFGRIGAVLLPVALLAVFFKYLHPLNAILHGIEGWGARKIALTLFISFFSIWSLLHVSSILFARIASWVWNGTSSNLLENISYSENKNREESLRNRVDFQNAKEREELIKVDLRDENAA